MVRIWKGGFSPIENVQTSPGPHPTSSSVGTGVLPQMIKRPGRECDHSPSEWGCTTPRKHFNNVGSENYTLYLSEVIVTRTGKNVCPAKNVL